ncbi:MAG: glycosyltransferase family 2 protein, partial [Candidatus Micrarchaeota archaeon]
MGRKVFHPGMKGWLLAAAAITLVLLATFYFIFMMVPYYVIFIFVNFFFLFVEIVYLLKFREEKEAERSSRFPSMTVLVPVYNSAKTLQKSLRAIKALKYPSRVEIIVIEDASSDGSYGIVRKEGGVDLIRTKENIGKAASLNLGLRKAKGELIATIDSDTYPEKDVLMKMVPHFTDEKVGAVVGLICANKPKNLLQRIQEVEYFV